MESLESARQDLVVQIRQGPTSDADRAGIDQRLAVIDQQLAAKQIAIAEADAQVARAAAVPGATAPSAQSNRDLATDRFEMGAITTTVLLIPIALAYARRIWRRSSVVISLPPELTDRLTTLEHSVDAVALEVERIGEGQRFVTQLMAERTSPLSALAQGKDDRQQHP